MHTLTHRITHLGLAGVEVAAAQAVYSCRGQLHWPLPRQEIECGSRPCHYCTRARDATATPE